MERVKMTLTKIVATPDSVTVVPLTAKELAQHETDRVAALAMKAAEDATKAQQATAKAALLTRLGITADEAKLLLS